MATGKAFLGVLALAGVGAWLAMSGDANAATSQKPGAGSGPFPGLSGCDVESNIPDDLKKTVSDFLTHKGLGPADYTDMAQKVSNAGYPKLAACIAEKAVAQNKKSEVEVVARGGMPFVIRYGDIPSHMALYYTGNGGRWKELGPLNPQIGSIQTVPLNGVPTTNFSHWNVGTEILIPASWNPLDKPLIPPLTGGGGSSSPSPAKPAQPAQPALPDPQATPPYVPGDQSGADTLQAIQDAGTAAAEGAATALHNMFGDPTATPENPGGVSGGWPL